MDVVLMLVIADQYRLNLVKMHPGEEKHQYNYRKDPRSQ